MRRITSRAAAIAVLLSGGTLLGGAALANAAPAPGATTSTPAAPTPVVRGGSVSADPLTPGDTVDNPADPQGGQHEASNEPGDAAEAQSGPETADPSGAESGPDSAASAQGDAETNDGPAPSTPPAAA